jgi:hypothetical protein
MGLFDDLKNLSEQVKRRQAHIKGEEATKQALILPFLQVLGYDVYDPTELQPEYVADFAKKKSNGQMEKVDYAIRLGGVPAIFIEAKAVDVPTEAHDAQLARYFNATPSVKTGVLTNGLKYRFFTDLQEPNIMSESPFFEFDILSFTERDVDTLRLFTKDSYDAGAVHASAEELIYVGKLTALVGELLRNPSESFVRFLLGEIDIVAGKRLTAKVIERFIPVVRKSIQTTLLEMATRSIRLETEEPKLAVVTPIPAPAPAPAPAATDAPPATGEGNSKVITTAEELEGLDLVKKLCADSSWSAKYPVLHKDSQNYFSMMVGHTRGWFLRLFSDSKRKAVVTRLSVERAAMLSPGFEVEAAPTGFGTSRVYLSGVKDLEKLRALVISAYEDAVKRLESGEDEGGSTATAS